jgi:triosephosphate isomerase (TIM)
MNLKSKKILACNWKMNPCSQSEVANLVKVYGQLSTSNCDLIVFPPAIFLNQFRELADVDYGLQEVSIAQSGAFTGQISAEMAKEYGCKYALVGHSETREYLGVDNTQIVNKISRSLKSGLTPVLCVGHSQNKQSTEIDYIELTEQLNTFVSVFEDKTLEYPQNIVVAYEPVWAIGTGKVATNELIFEVAEFIKNHLSQTLSFESSFEIKVLYGGSVNAKNISVLNEIENIDGYLVGGASLIPDEIISMCKAI